MSYGCVRHKIGKMVILRPGALGDVLSVRGVIRFVKDCFPEAEVCLAAPGERGAFFRRDGWADRTFDWERAAFSWLFLDSGQDPPPALRAVFSGCDLIVSYVDAGAERDDSFLEAKCKAVAPSASMIFCPSRPPKGHEEPIGEWLLRPVVAFCQQCRFLPSGKTVDLPGLAASRMACDARPGAFPEFRRYAVVHPGSGSRSKNWPLGRYEELCAKLLRNVGPDGSPTLDGMVITSGEADGDLGYRLSSALPGAAHLHEPSLPVLASVLAGAALYIGNDSGVSHLASAVDTASGKHPRLAVIFGPSDPEVWCPPGAMLFRAGEGFADLSVDDVFMRIMSEWHDLS